MVGRAIPAEPVDHAHLDRQLDLSAAVAGADGAALLTVSRHSSVTGTGGPPAVVLTVIGQVDLETVELFRTALLEAVDAPRWVCCDLGGVDFFGAAGVNALVAARTRALETGARLAVCGAGETVRRVLTITGLDGLLLRRC